MFYNNFHNPFEIKHHSQKIFVSLGKEKSLCSGKTELYFFEETTNIPAKPWTGLRSQRLSDGGRLLCSLGAAGLPRLEKHRGDL